MGKTGNHDQLKAVAVKSGTGGPEFPRSRAALALGSALVLGAASADAKPKGDAPPPTKGSIDGHRLGRAPELRVVRGYGIHASPQISEDEVELYLSWQFAHHGLDIRRHVPINHDGITFTCDGYDPVRNVGFFHQRNSKKLADNVREALARWQSEGVAAILVLDDFGTPDQATLTLRVDRFFKRLKRAMPKPGPLDPGSVD